MAELPRLPPNLRIVGPDGAPTLEFSVYWQRVLEAIERLVTDVADALQNVIDLNDLITEANTAIAAADAAAAAAATAASTAQTVADNVSASTELAQSYVSGLTLSASDAGADATITISAHTRHYPQADGTTTTVSVNAGSVTGQPYSTFIYLYYDDPARAGGAVTYAATPSATTAAQTGVRHTVGGVQTPAAAGPPSAGAGTRPPGTGTLAV